MDMMTLWIIYSVISLIVMVFLTLIGSMVMSGDNQNCNKELYECGIESILTEKTPFYLHFFPVGVLFLLFDIELIVCIPLTGMILDGLIWESYWMVLFLILFVGLSLEITMGSLDWKE